MMDGSATMWLVAVRLFSPLVGRATENPFQVVVLRTTSSQRVRPPAIGFF